MRAPAADGTALPLRWGEYRPGELIRGRWGLLEPAEPWLPESALAEAALVVVPALAVDRRGVRLGRGRGFYDRSLAGRDPRARLIAMVRDDELVDELPAEPHDVRDDARHHAAAWDNRAYPAVTSGNETAYAAVLALRHYRVLIKT